LIQNNQHLVRFLQQQVILAANSRPALNDVTYSELQIITEKVAAICPVIK
jgi:type II pantothenate kinase